MVYIWMIVFLLLSIKQVPHCIAPSSSCTLHSNCLGCFHVILLNCQIKDQKFQYLASIWNLIDIVNLVHTLPPTFGPHTVLGLISCWVGAWSTVHDEI